jgi:catechol 2,3-dioxygenase-like lactoylglutathione lyase family enzyme
MKYTSTLIAVKNMEKAKQFYHSVLGLDIIADFGANVILTGGIALQTIDTWKDFIHKQDNEIIFGNNATELYFEDDDIESFAAKLENFKNIEYVHPLFEHPWGQRVVRFYDLDKHIIEVGENMVVVVKRFIDGGFTEEEVAAHMDVPLDYVVSCLA